MQVRMLGTLALDGVAIPGARLAALAETLLLARGRVVPTGALIEAVWDGDEPADSRAALQALASRLRRRGLPVRSLAGGYRVDLTGVDVDLYAAQELLAGARAAAGRGHHDEARMLAARGLAHFDGPPADDVARLHADLLAARATADLATGRGVGDLDALRAAADRDPTDEPLAALLMRALAAAGQEAEALRRFETLRATLADRFGTDPSSLVADVHVALLRGELATGGAPRTTSAASAVLPGAAEAAPTAPAPQAAPHSWRRPRTDLVGRDDDVRTLEVELARSPLVTLVAVGGAGKTRLAVEVARRATDRGEPVYAVELAGVRDPAEVLPALLASLGASESTTEGSDPTVRRVLGPQERMLRAVAALGGLLVLDNCEHLLAAAAEVASQVIEAAGPELRILATSRAPLGIHGETVHPVTALPDAAALTLLESRARAVRPTLVWDAAIALELCHRLDNLPLALELAAARLRAMPLPDVLAGIEHRFALLDNALRGLPDRHQGLWAMVDWSWALLDARCQVLLRDLAVIPAPFTAAMALAVAGSPADTGSPADADLRGLAVLVEQSLLTLEEPGDELPARYRMLETVREYGEARLADEGTRDEVMGRLTGWAAREARALREGYLGTRQLAALRATTDDNDTFTVTLRWALDHGHDAEAFAIAAALMTVWTLRGLHIEAGVWGAQLLHTDSPSGRRRTWALLRADAASPSPRAIPDPDDVATVATVVALTSGFTHDLRAGALSMRLARWAVEAGGDRVSHRARVLTRSALELTTAPDIQLATAGGLVDDPDPSLRGLGLFLRAAARENAGDATESADDAHRAYAIFESIGDHWGMGITAGALGQWETGRDGADADRWLTVAIEHLELVGAVQDARALRMVRSLRRALDGSTEAAASIEEALRSPSSSLQERAQASLGLGVLAARRGDWAEAVARADAAVDAARREEPLIPQAWIVVGAAAAVLRIRAGLDGAALLAAAAQGASAITDMPVLGAVAQGYAELAASRGDGERSDELWALGARLGANLSTLLGPPPGGPDATDRASARSALAERARSISAADTAARLAALIDEV